MNNIAGADTTNKQESVILTGLVASNWENQVQAAAIAAPSHKMAEYKHKDKTCRSWATWVRCV